ncbi:hypothetical protein PTTG_09905 [Puccinia triticina 1-1 BBBD Race 1]|uniref:Uncharacterized protein n=1 Tax=Puccinia triticina (isolate 1-1 / race 1 (BBBD)) TaxID=630390 RepID=A0A180GGX8_PUCT1|nr:hypothetical protein PTTG_09905 [Puccinia triticina 1-1 BBBD Race 1]
MLNADGSNFNQWKRALNRTIRLTLGHTNFFDVQTNRPALTEQESSSLLFLIQVTVHDELLSIADSAANAVEAFEAIQTNFQGSI